MKKNHITRAWKDAEYRAGLSESERSLLPANPAGRVELSENDLRRVTGGQDVLTCDCGTRFADSCVHPPVQCP